MTTIAEHLGTTPGLAYGICPTHCGHLFRIFGAAACAAFDSRLTQTNGQVNRCADCMKHGRNHRPAED